MPNPSPPLILVVDNSRAVTGAVNAMRHTTGPLRAAGVAGFEWVVPTGSAARAVLVADGYAVHELPFVEISRRKKDLLLYGPLLLLNGWRLARLARARGAGVLHFNDFYNLTGYVARLLVALRGGRLRLITHVRFLPQTQQPLLARVWRGLAERFAARVICVSEAVRAYFGPAEKVLTIYDPLPGAEKYPAPVRPPDASDRPDGPDDTVRLLYLGNFIAGKGQNFALEAFALAYADAPHLRLHLAGGDMGMPKNQAYRQSLEAEAARRGLTEVITFGGFVADVEAAIKAADVVLNFSESESFSLTCLDALYYGTALIASDCGGPRELFEDGRSGRLVPNRDVAAMAAAMLELGRDAVLRAAFAAAGREFVRHKFRPAATHERLAALYGELGLP